MTRAKGRNQAKQQGANLRKGSRYFVANPDDVRVAEANYYNEHGKLMPSAGRL